MGKNIGGLFSDNDLLNVDGDEIRFDFSKTILQILNTAYFISGEHWLVLAKLPGKNFQLFDSDIKYVQNRCKIDTRDVSDIPEILQMPLPHDLEIVLVYLCWQKLRDDGGLKIDIMDCTQQKNAYDCGPFACLNAIHWASENSIPPDYLDNSSSDMTIPREKLQEFMYGGCDSIPRASAKADKVLKTIMLNPKCNDKNCEYETSSNAPSEVNMFKCFKCLCWFHNRCNKPDDQKLGSIFRTYCQYCAEFLQFTDQSNEPHFNMTRTEAQGGVQTHQFYEDEKKPSTQLYAREANNKQSRVSPAGDPKLRKTIGLEVESEPCTHSSVTNQQVDDIFSDNDSECDKTPHEWDRISEDNSSNSSVPTDWEERNIEDNRDTDTEELL